MFNILDEMNNTIISQTKIVQSLESFLHEQIERTNITETMLQN